ncbi:hypothetical protein ACI78T_06715 [Blastococcus sp. SYSU D00922]
MRLQETMRMVEAARAELERARSDTAGWSDDLRRRFDAQRFQPLVDAGTRMVVALQRAQEQADRVQRQLEP